MKYLGLFKSPSLSFVGSSAPVPATPESTNLDPHSRTPFCKDDVVETLCEGPYDGRVPPSAAACDETTPPMPIVLSHPH